MRLGGLIGLRRFDTPAQIAKAVHSGTLALRVFGTALGDADVARIKLINPSCLDSAGISMADREWLMAKMRAVLGKAGESQPAEERIH